MFEEKCKILILSPFNGINDLEVAWRRYFPQCNYCNLFSAPPTLGLDNSGATNLNASLFGWYFTHDFAHHCQFGNFYLTPVTFVGNTQAKSLFPQNTGFRATTTPSFGFGGISVVRPTGIVQSLEQPPSFGLASGAVQSTGFGPSIKQAPTFGLASGVVRPTGFGPSIKQAPAFGLGQSTSGFGSNLSFGNTSAVRPLGK